MKTIEDNIIIFFIMTTIIPKSYIPVAVTVKISVLFLLNSWLRYQRPALSELRRNDVNLEQVVSPTGQGHTCLEKRCYILQILPSRSGALYKLKGSSRIT